MILGFIKNQELKIEQPMIVSDTIDYLEIKFTFITDDWNGLTKYAHFKQGETVYDVEIDSDNEIKKTQHLNLSTGNWEVYLHGTEYNNGVVKERITTQIEKIKVRETGILNGEPFPSAIPSISEQILAKIGDMEHLDTEAKDTLVNAINEAYNHSVNQIYMGENKPTDENILIWIDTYVPPITGTQLITADNLGFITSDNEIFILHEPAMLLTSNNENFIDANNKNFKVQ